MTNQVRVKNTDRLSAENNQSNLIKLIFINTENEFRLTASQRASRPRGFVFHVSRLSSSVANGKLKFSNQIKFKLNQIKFKR